MLQKSLLKFMFLALLTLSMVFPNQAVANPERSTFKHAVIIVSSLMALGIGSLGISHAMTNESLKTRDRVLNIVCGSIFLLIGTGSFLFSELALDTIELISEESIKMLREAVQNR